MKEIDINTWPRKEHFNLFLHTAYPIYNITFNLDVTKAKAFSKQKALSFNLLMIYLSTKALNSIENFRYRLEDGRVILYDILNPSYTTMDPGSDLFKMVTVEMKNDAVDFIKTAKEKEETQKEYFPADIQAEKDNLVFYSAMPWISFTSIDHTRTLKKEDTVQRVTFGKYFQQGSKILMPYNIQVNHLFVDGFHLGLLKDALDKLIAGLS